MHAFVCRRLAMVRVRFMGMFVPVLMRMVVCVFMAMLVRVCVFCLALRLTMRPIRMTVHQDIDLRRGDAAALCAMRDEPSIQVER